MISLKDFIASLPDERQEIIAYGFSKIKRDYRRYLHAKEHNRIKRKVRRLKKSSIQFKCNY